MTNGSGRPPTPLAQRFWPKVDTSAGPNACWPWTGHQAPTGYGQIGAGGRSDGVLYAHRVSYELNFGPIPDGLYVCHTCDNPPCVNPGHLFAGTPTENSHDARDKGRLVMPRLRGEDAAPAVLTETQAREIIARRAAGEKLTDLSRRFGVSESAISQLARGRTWRHLERDAS